MKFNDQIHSGCVQTDTEHASLIPTHEPEVPSAFLLGAGRTGIDP